jgi:exopolyphosphatase/guanosine-5'-triphosphate,3'-diphosphate pyrophosphatase
MPDSPEPVASVIDIGSNTIKFLVVRGQSLEILADCSEDTRIGTGMGRGGLIRLLPEAMEAGAACVKSLWDRARVHRPDFDAIVATSAVRDAVNREKFVSMIRRDTGMEPRILSGEDEARYVGRGVSMDPNIDRFKPFYLMDLGGGSLEILEFRDGQVLQKVSLPLGAVRLMERIVEDPEAPMDKGEIAEVSEYVAESVFASGFDFRNAAPMVGTGGGMAHARIFLGREQGLSPRESNPYVSISQMKALTYRLAGMSLKERRNMEHLPAARADIMPVAMIVMTTVLELAKAGGVIHSFYNLRFGIAAELLANGSH